MMKVRHLIFHAWPSCLGIGRLLLRSPGWTIRLLTIRTIYFFSRRIPPEVKTPDGYRITSASELISYWTFFVEREGWQPEWGKELKSLKNPTVLDVGANAGVFSHWIWTQNRTVKLIAFEPLPKMAARIREWHAHSGANLTLCEAAVSDHIGKAVFHAAAENDTNASLRPDSPKSIRFEVPTVTLDSVVPSEPVLLAKIDVEGCEPEALAGAVKTLAQVRFVLVEVNSQEKFDKIRALLPEKIWNYRKTGQSDYFFFRL